MRARSRAEYVARRPRPVAMRSAAKPCRLKRATRSATVVPLCKPASWAAWMNTPLRATASNALARRTTSTRSVFLLTIRSKVVSSLRLSFRSGSRCGVGILAPSGQVSGKDSSSGHLGHDPLVLIATLLHAVHAVAARALAMRVIVMRNKVLDTGPHLLSVITTCEDRGRCPAVIAGNCGNGPQPCFGQ